MIKYIWSLLCQESVINEDDKSLSINKIIEGIDVLVKIAKNKKIDGKIRIPLRYEIVCFFTREGKNEEEEKGFVRVKLIDPKEEELSQHKSEISIGRARRSLRLRIKINGITITEAGTYQFAVSMKNKGDEEFFEVVRIPLEVKIVTTT